MAKAAWDPEYHRVFVDLCFEEKLLGNKPGTHNILLPFQQRTGARFKKNQLKNHWDTMIKQWKIWRRLVQCTDMKWDPITNTFGATDQDWADYLQLNPDAAPYRLDLPLFLTKLEFIFEGSNSDNEGTSVSQRKPRIEYPNEDNDTGDEDRQSASNVATAHPKGYWSRSTHELFVDLLVEETRKRNSPGAHYPKESWKMMLETINKSSGRTYTRAQLKNHWDSTRKGWKIWCQLIAAPIMKWDAKSRSFGATADDWEVYLLENPRARDFRNKHVRHPDKLATIFAGVIEPGKAYFRPYRKRAREHHSESPQLHDPTPLSTLYTNEPFTGNENGDYNDGHEEPTQRRRRFNGVGFAESRLQDVEIVTPAGHCVNTQRVNESPVSASVKQFEFTIGECIECLDAMEEVEQGSDLYMFALDLFLKKEYREVFLQLKNSNVRMSWLLRRRCRAA